MFRCKLRTLLIVLALAPPALAGLRLNWPLLVASVLLGTIAAAVLFGMGAILSGDQARLTELAKRLNTY